MENYNKIILITENRILDITYEEYVMHVASVERNWDRIIFKKDGMSHRLDGPAVECADGTRMWYVNSKLHRLDGPAIEWADGDKAWLIDSAYYVTEHEYLEAVERYKKRRTITESSLLLKARKQISRTRSM